MGIFLLRCVHGNKRIGTHDTIHDTFATIGRNTSFNVAQEQLHVLPSTTFNFFPQWVDIVFSKDGICTLVEVVIVDPTRADLLPQSCATQGFTTSDVTQAKERSYHNWAPTNQFLPLVIEVFGYLC